MDLDILVDTVLLKVYVVVASSQIMPLLAGENKCDTTECAVSLLWIQIRCF